MICCKECIELLHDYLDGELSPGIEASLEDHFADCPPCIALSLVESENPIHSQLHSSCLKIDKKYDIPL